MSFLLDKEFPNQNKSHRNKKYYLKIKTWIISKIAFDAFGFGHVFLPFIYEVFLEDKSLYESTRKIVITTSDLLPEFFFHFNYHKNMENIVI